MHVTHRPHMMPGRPQDAAIFLNHGEGGNFFCVYEHHIFTDHGDDLKWSLFYVGACRLRDVFNNPDALRNTHFAKLAKGTIVSIRIIMTTENETEAFNKASSHAREFKAPCNMYGGQRSPFTRVRCIETNIIYSSANAASAALSISQSALSQHLRRIPGFKSVKGHTFELVS